MNRHVRILLVAGYVWYLGEGLLGPLFAVFAQRVGGSVLQITWAWAVYMVTTGVLAIVFGRLSDSRIGKVDLMMLGYSLNTSATFGYLLVSSPMTLLIVQFVLGVALAMALPTWQALYALTARPGRMGTAWGLQGGGDRIVLGLAAVLGGLVVSWWSFTALFVVMGFVQLLATVVQAQIRR